MPSHFALATSRPVVLRALRYAAVVGAILIGINHGDAILRGDLTGPRVLRMLLTICVPYLVSTLSSIEALRDTAAVSTIRHEEDTAP